MMIVFANTKGGVGKSTLAVHLAVWLYDAGFQVAFLDCDKQQSSSQWLAEAERNIACVVATTPEMVVSDARRLLTTHDFLIGDGPAGLDDLSRTLLILADLAILPVTPSVLDLRSVTQATATLRYAQEVNGGRPEGKLLLNRMKSRGRISREIHDAAPSLGVAVASQWVRSLEAFVDAAQQGSVVTRRRAQRGPNLAGDDLDRVFAELLNQPMRVKQRRFKNGGR